jgi:cytosine deaminase
MLTIGAGSLQAGIDRAGPLGFWKCNGWKETGMKMGTASDTDLHMMRVALTEAQKGYDEGGVPVGSAIAEGEALLAAGRNRRVQDGDPIAHGEMDCLRRLGRRRHYKSLTLYTTLSPCMMCAGTIVQFEVPRLVIGENRNFSGNIPFIQSHGVEVVLVDDPDCIALMERFIRERPELWFEDIAVEHERKH